MLYSPPSVPISTSLSTTVGDRRHSPFRDRRFRLPDHLSGLGVKRHQLQIERAQESLSPAIATPRLFGPQQKVYRPHLVLVMPELLAGLLIDRDTWSY